VYPTSLATHLRTAHGYDKVRLKRTCKEIEKQQTQIALSLKEHDFLQFSIQEHSTLNLLGFGNVFV